MWSEVGVGVKGGSDVEASGVVPFKGGNARLEEVTRVPEVGAVVHVLVEPLVTHREVELLDQKDELCVEGSEEGECPLEELD